MADMDKSGKGYLADMDKDMNKPGKGYCEMIHKQVQDKEPDQENQEPEYADVDLSPLPSPPDISIVLATYNQVDLLKNAVDSILKQTYTNFEFIIINDGSTDGTRDYIESLTDKRIIKVHFEQNRGFVYAYNLGFKMARGKYCTFISSDNIYYPDFLMRLLYEFANDSGNLGFVYSKFRWVNKKYETIVLSDNSNISPHVLLSGNPGVASFLFPTRIIHELQSQIESPILREFGILDPRVRFATDTDLWARICKNYKVKYIPTVLCDFMTDPSCESSKQGEKGAWEALKLVAQKHYLESIRVHRRNKPLRVLFIIPNSIRYSRAGVETYAHRLAAELNQRNDIDVFILYRFHIRNGDKKEGFEFYTIDKVPYFELACNSPANLNTQILDPKVKSMFIEFMDHNRFDLIHFHHILGLPIELISDVNRWHYPHIVSLHDFFLICPLAFMVSDPGSDCPPCRFVNASGCARCILRNQNYTNCTPEIIASQTYWLEYRYAMVKYILANSPYVSAVSHYVKSIFDEFMNKTININVVSPGIEYAYSFGSSESASRKLVFAFIGSVHPIKRVDKLAQIFKKLHPEWHDYFEFRVYGDCPDKVYQEEIRRIYPETKFFGSFDPKNLKEVLKVIDYLVIPSAMETYGFVAREALHCGIWIISMEVGAIVSEIFSACTADLCRDFNSMESVIHKRIREFAVHGEIKTTSYGTYGGCYRLPTILEEATAWAWIYKGLIRNYEDQASLSLMTELKNYHRKYPYNISSEGD